MYNLAKYVLFTYILACCNSSYCTDDSLYMADDSFNTDHLTFHRIRSAQQDIESYKAIYEDSGFRNSWFMDVSTLPDNLYTSSDPELIQNYDIECLQKRELLGFYNLPISFTDYNVHDSRTQELVGRFILKNERVVNGRIEKGIYVLKKFRGNGLSVEIFSGVLKHIIEPAIGKSFIISYYPDFNYPDVFKTKRHDNFQGVFSKISPWYNYPSLASSHRAGCVLRWEDFTPATYYPSGDEAHMDQYDVKNFKATIQDFFQMSESLHARTPTIPSRHYFPKDLFAILTAPNNKLIRDRIVENLHNLLITDETYTIASTIEALISSGETTDRLRNELFPEKAKYLLSISGHWRLPLYKYRSLLESLSIDEKSDESNR